MRKRKRQYQQCIAKAADGSRCGKWALPGTTVCSAHDPSRKPTGVIAAQDSDDPATLYKRLMKDKDAQIRLRALNAYLDWEAKQKRGCKVCADRAANEQLREELLDAMTERETEELRDALLEVGRIKERVYQRSPRLRPVGSIPLPTQQEATDGEESTVTGVARRSDGDGAADEATTVDSVDGVGSVTIA